MPLDKGTIALMYRVMEENRPPEPTEWELGTFPDAASLRLQTTDHGIAVRLRLDDGTDTTLHLNAVVARHFAISIITMGQQASWLDDAANVIPRPPEPLDS